VKSRGVGTVVTIGLVVCAGGAVAWLVFAPRPEVPSRPAVDSTQETPPPTPPAAQTLGVASAATGVPGAQVAAEPGAAPTRLPPYEGPVRDRGRADQLREALTALVVSKHGTEDGTMPSSVGSGNQAKEALGRYVDAVMQEQFVPLAGSCYEALLETKSAAHGTVTLDFSIVGDRSVGGVVLEVEMALGPALKGGEFEMCLRESMYAVVFDAPPGEDGTVSVTQSFELSP
jgi:hypothetical protein